MTRGDFNVLFLCTGNSARSIMAEALLNQLAAHAGPGGLRCRGCSAGSAPTGRVNPLTLEVLAAAGVGTAGLRSKGFGVFEGPEAPRLDLVISVCDAAAREPCPVWPGAPASAHWSLPDPAAVEGTPAERRAAFERVLETLRRHLQALLALPLAELDRQSLASRVNAIPAAASEPGFRDSEVES